jgi:hypothetical protein
MDFGDGLKYEFVYDQPNINWSVDMKALSLYPNETIKMNHGGIQGKGRNLYDALDGKMDLNTALGEVPVIFVRTNVGHTVKLLSSIYHGPELHKMGISSRTAFGCAFDYLIQINNESRRLVAEDFSKITSPEVLSIGIQIREGDQTMKNALKSSAYQITTHENRKYFLDCASLIEHQLINELDKWNHKRILWYLVTDSISSRKELKQLIGDKLIVNVRHEIAHSRHYSLKLSGEHGKSTSEQGIVEATTNEEVIEAFRLAAAENWLLSLTNFKVISGWSGYGRIASAQSMMTGTTFSIRGSPQGGKLNIQDRNCSLNQSDDILKFSNI